ncbi:MAG: PcfJ domain-containing protein [Defluviitaleaceae bacterium]|nr:PcfJ domain-containing protein [Defluviitaleaceae bacterium]
MSSQGTDSAVNIKDYLIAKSPSVHLDAASPYKVLLQTESDFIISRKSRKGRADRELVILISEALFYFKEKDKIEEITYKGLADFLSGLGRQRLALEQVLWLSSLNKSDIHRLLNIITRPALIEMARANMLTQSTQAHDNWRMEHWEKSPALYKNVYASLSNISPCQFQVCVNLAFEIYSRFGYGEALYFIEALGKSKFEQFTCEHDRRSRSGDLNGFIQLLDEPYSLELRRLIDYTVDSYVQGITRVNCEFWQAYEQYLAIQLRVFGEIRDKYPRYLMTAYNIAALNINLMERIHSDEEFAELAAEVRSLAYEDKLYSVIVPTTAQQLAEEGITLGHCMGANAEQIMSSGLHILFLRNSNAKETPLVTLRYSNNAITGAEGLNRRGLTDAEREFLEVWGREKGVCTNSVAKEGNDVYVA